MTGMTKGKQSEMELKAFKVLERKQLASKTYLENIIFV